MELPGSISLDPTQPPLAVALEAISILEWKVQTARQWHSALRMQCLQWLSSTIMMDDVPVHQH